MSKNNIDFFKTEQDMYIFALTRTDGVTRQNILKITQGMYSNSRKANRWYNNILGILGPETDENSAAITKLNKLYENMISY